jgi:hypothetical protein
MRCMTATLVTLGTQGALAAREQKVRGFWMARLLQSPILRAPGAMGSPIALIKGQTARGFTWPGSGQMKSDDAPALEAAAKAASSTGNPPLWTQLLRGFNRTGKCPHAAGGHQGLVSSLRKQLRAPYQIGAADARNAVIHEL